MKKLIKADLSGILKLAGEHQPIMDGSVERSIALLQHRRHTDYLFLAHRGAAGCPTCQRCTNPALPQIWNGWPARASQHGQ